jgi:hypothetical protein
MLLLPAFKEKNDFITNHTNRQLVQEPPRAMFQLFTRDICRQQARIRIQASTIVKE